MEVMNFCPQGIVIAKDVQMCNGCVMWGRLQYTLEQLSIILGWWYLCVLCCRCMKGNATLAIIPPRIYIPACSEYCMSLARSVNTQHLGRRPFEYFSVSHQLVAACPDKFYILGILNGHRLNPLRISLAIVKKTMELADIGLVHHDIRLVLNLRCFIL